jgi:hypothetical protein
MQNPIKTEFKEFVLKPSEKPQHKLEELSPSPNYEPEPE